MAAEVAPIGYVIRKPKPQNLGLIDRDVGRLLALFDQHRTAAGLGLARGGFCES